MAFEPQEWQIQRRQVGRETREDCRARLIAEHEAQEHADTALQEQMKQSYEAHQAEQERVEGERRAERQKAANATLLANARGVFFANGAATEEDFAAAWPSLRAELLQNQAIDALARTGGASGKTEIERLVERMYPMPSISTGKAGQPRKD